MIKIIFSFTLFSILLFNQLFAQTSEAVNRKHIAKKQLYYGAAYYPEAWTGVDIRKDIAHMKALNMNVMRMAEFSWALMEPEEGKYEFGWLHKIIDELYKNDIEVILGTPTATPPIWLATKHPEIFLIDEDGNRRQHGARRNCNYSNKIYQEYSVKICEALAKEFGKKPGVIGWQTDNEFNLAEDFTPETQKLWHQWLEQKYGTIDHLNKVWFTNLWSQRYEKFSQIPMPHSRIWHHPALRLDWILFSEEQVIIYQNLQLEAIRKYSDLPITHDGMPGQQLNYPKLFKDLDFSTTNVYHSFQVYNRVQSNYDRIRGYGKGMHWLFETAPNHSGGGKKGNAWFIHQPEGSMRAAIWMNYAMGGQGSLFWLWRQQGAGQEMPHGAILSAWGQPVANYDELKNLGKEIKDLGELLMEHPVKGAEVAIYYDHDNDKVLRIEESANGIRYYNQWTNYFYRPISDAYIHRDVINWYSDISQYKLIFLPLSPIIPEAGKEKLKKWVEQGGTLVLGPMSGYRNQYFGANTDFALGNLEPWMGINVATRLPIDKFADESDINLKVKLNQSYGVEPENAALWSEALTSKKGEVLATYLNGMHDGKNAIIENKVGKGKVVLIGSFPGKSAMKALVLDLAKDQNISPLGEGDPDVLIVPRGNQDNEYYFVINLKNEEQEVILPFQQFSDEFTEAKYQSGKLTLKPFEVMCLLKNRQILEKTR
ncbi:beta-galactosidase [Flexithrix dorotheae]|uniref:beta-galactosidase n=1 Tax=Flexithrix dorotheae TaxID=70993 RepID=UPI00036C27A2|nr:beta-galactosidase [Flexithrix dorotheae]